MVGEDLAFGVLRWGSRLVASANHPVQPSAPSGTRGLVGLSNLSGEISWRRVPFVHLPNGLRWTLSNGDLYVI
jgi:hypothetical protein